jgi:peptidase E
MDKRRIVVIGGGGFLQDDDWKPEGSMEDWLVRLARPKGDKERPDNRVRVCFLGQASAENESMRSWFYQAFSQLNCLPTHFDAFHNTTLLGKPVANVRDLLLSQDLIYVGGGNTANMLAVWRAQGIDKLLREAWESGVVLSGMSAGANCWFEKSTTDSFGVALQPLHDGLGFLEGSLCPHYDGEKPRRPLFEKLIGDDIFPEGWGIDDHAALLFRGRDPSVAVATRPHKGVYRVANDQNCTYGTALPVRNISDET